MLFLSFDKAEGNTVIDESGNGNDAEINGAPEQVNGQFGMAMSFDGAADFLIIPNNKTLNPEQITMMVWANPDDIAGCHRTISKDDGSLRDYQLP